jgi:hypothetical protein
MTDKCYDIGIIQAFLDGELASDFSEAVARHVSMCDDCAVMLATAEEESALAFSALEQEFNTLVPTQRLWTKINDSIERERKSFWKPLFAFLLKPQTAAFASLLFVAVVSINQITQVNQTKQIPAPVVFKNQPNDPVGTNAPVPVPQTPAVRRNSQPANYEPNKNEIRAVKTSIVKSKVEDIKPPFDSPQTVTPAPGESIRGEESYLKTIETLSQTVNDGYKLALSSSARFALERDLAVTDDAIEKMRKEVRKNPNNEAAKQILRASYQNKIDLLNSVADKTELMASIK